MTTRSPRRVRPQPADRRHLVPRRPRRRSLRHAARLLLVAGAFVVGYVIFSASPAHAATHTWTGANDSNWNDVANWDPPVVPIGPADLVFPSAVVTNKTLTNDLLAGLDVSSISVGDGYTIGGNSINLAAGNTGISFTDGTTSVLNLPMQFLGTTTVTGTGTGRIGGIVSGAGGLTKTGAGTLILSGANTYAGSTTVSLGVLRLGASNVIPDASDVSLATAAAATLDLNDSSDTVRRLTGGSGANGNITLGTGTLTVAPNGTSSYGGLITGTGGVTKNGSFALALGGANTYTGPTTVNTGTLRLGGENAVPANSAVTIANDATAVLDLSGFSTAIGSLATSGGGAGRVLVDTGVLTINQSTDTTFAGTITSTVDGSIVKAGTGNLTLSGANGSFLGALAVDSGTLTAGNTTALGSAAPGTTVADGATLAVDLNVATAETISIRGSGDGGGGALLAVANATVSGTVTMVAASEISAEGASTLILDGPVAGAFELTKCGLGAVEVNGGIASAPSVIIDEGILRIGSAGAIPDTTSVSLADDPTAALDLANISETVGTLSGGGTLGGNVTLGTATLTVNQGTNALYGGDVTGTGGITKRGSSRLDLDGASAYSGATTIEQGTLRVVASGALPDPSPIVLADAAGAALELDDINETIGPLSGGGPAGGNVVLGSGTLTVEAGQATVYSGVVSGTGSLVKTGTATLTISRTAAYSGTTTVNDGTLRLGVVNALPARPVILGGGGGLLDLNGFGQTITSLSGGTAVGGTGIALGIGTLVVNQAVNTSFSGAITGTGSGGLTKLGSGILTFDAAAHSYTGTTTITAGTLRLGASEKLPDTAALDIGPSGTLDLDGFSESTGPLSGSGGIAFNGAGTSLTIDQGAANSTYSGVISGVGELRKSGTGRLTLSGVNTFTEGTEILQGTLRVGAPGAIPNTEIVTIGPGGSTTLDLNRINETIGAIAGGGGGVTLGSDGTPGSGGTLTTSAGVDSAFSGVISGDGGFVKAGAGRLTLSGASTYTGSTTISGGALILGVDDALPDRPLAIAGGASLETNTRGDTVGDLTGSGNIVLGLGPGLTISQQSATTYSGGSTGNGSISKAGPGTLTASGSLSHTGPIVVLAGRLDITGTAAGFINLGGGTLGGTGTVGDVEDVGPGGVIAPGTSPGVLDTGNVTFTSATSFAPELNGTVPDTGHDQLNVTGTVTLGGASLSPSLGFAPANGTVFVIIANDNTDPVVGQFAGLAEGADVFIGVRRFTISYAGGTGNDVTLTAAIRPSITALGQSSAATTAGTTVTFTAAVSKTDAASGTPTGPVTFMDGATTLGTSPISSGQATFATSGLGVGSHTITAVYNGDAAFGASVSGPLTHAVSAVPPAPVPPVAPAPVPPVAPAPAPVRGYRLLDGAGNLHGFGHAPFLGSLPGRGVTVGVVDLEATGDGAYALDRVGGVHAFGASPFLGSLPGRGIATPSVDIEAVGDGYYVLDHVGGVHAFGGAPFLGSLPGRGIATPVVDLEAVPGGYYVLDRVGGVHAFGSAPFIDSLPGRSVATEAVDLEAAGGGYVVLDAAGGTHAFGAGIPFHGSLPGLRDAGLLRGSVPVTDLALAPSGDGYYVLERNGGVHAFGPVPFHGSMAGSGHSLPFVGLEVTT